MFTIFHPPKNPIIDLYGFAVTVHMKLLKEDVDFGDTGPGSGDEGVSPPEQQRVASVVVVNELKSVERHVVETHEVRPTGVETPPVSVQP